MAIDQWAIRCASCEVPKVVESLSPGFPELTTAAGERVQGILRDEEVVTEAKGPGDRSKKPSDSAKKLEHAIPSETPC